jgi:hypothetical protein
MSTPAKPVAKIGFPVTASIWRNEGKGRVFYSATFQLTYKDSDGNRKHTTSFGMEDLLPLAKIADLAHTEIGKLKAADRQAQSPDDMETSDE